MTRIIAVAVLSLLCSCKGDLGMQGVPGPVGEKGPQGPKGDQGIQGMQGPQGMQGVSAQTMSLLREDGGEIGPIISTGSNTLNTVYLLEEGCVGQIDWNSSTVRPFQTQVHYTQLNCTGVPFVSSSIPMYPATCMAVGTSMFKARQPIFQQTMMGQSTFQPWAQQSDGGFTSVCTNEYTSVQGAVVDSFIMTTTIGPLYLGRK